MHLSGLLKNQLKFISKKSLKNRGFTFSNRGFTLIEMIVTVGIMLAVTGGGIAAFMTFDDKQSIQTSAQELQTILRSAQTKARVGEDAEYCRATYVGETLRGYRVQVLEGTNIVFLDVVCSANKFTEAIYRNYPPDLQRSYTLAEGVEIEMQGGGEVNMEFLTLLGGVDGFGTIEVSGNGSDVYTFEVTQGGEITEGSF